MFALASTHIITMWFVLLNPFGAIALLNFHVSWTSLSSANVSYWENMELLLPLIWSVFNGFQKYITKQNHLVFKRNAIIKVTFIVDFFYLLSDFFFYHSFLFLAPINLMLTTSKIYLMWDGRISLLWLRNIYIECNKR